MTNNLIRACVFLCACACATSVGAQQTPSDGEPQAPGGNGQTTVALPTGFLDRAFAWGADKADVFSESRDGLYPALGGLISGSGLPIGAGYRHRVFGSAIVDASATTSSKRYTMMQSRMVWPHLRGDRLSIGAQVQYDDFTQINYFGVGAGSLKANQTDYRLRQLDAGGFATLQLDRNVMLSTRAGLLRRVNVGSGSSVLYPGIAEQFDESTAPGLTQQPTYLHAELAVEADTRNVPGYPTSGGRYRVSVASFHDRDFSQYSFRRVEADGAQYVPVFGKSVLAVRGRVALTGTGAGQVVPFYLLPTLGGSRSLRGYDDYRFRDRDLLLMNAEYRWPILRVLDGAAFYDAGTVAPTMGQLATHRLTTDYGFGLRVHARNRQLVRADVARGREGVRVLLSFSTPFGWSNQSAAPYVP